MTILNLGSINIDIVYRVPHIPAPGETLAATGYSKGLGGKGANMSMAAVAGGGQVLHVGCVGADGDWCVEQLERWGVDCASVVAVSGPTGHAVICVDDLGENSIVIHPGANRMLTHDLVDDALTRIRKGWLLLQNETNLRVYAAEQAKMRGLRVAYAAAPFDAEAAQEMLPHVDLLAVNAVEAEQLGRAMGTFPESLPVEEVLITKGAEGAVWRGQGERVELPAHPVEAVDTTGAGDTFLGVFLGRIDSDKYPEAAMERALAAAAIQVTRPGAASAIPTPAEIDKFLMERGK